MTIPIGASSERGRSFVSSSKVVPELTQKVFTRFDWFIPSETKGIINQPLMENKPMTVLKRFWYFITHGHFVETQIAKERVVITRLASCFRDCYTEIKNNKTMKNSNRFVYEDSNKYKVSIDRVDNGYSLTIEDTVSGDKIEKALNSQKLDKLYLSVLFGLGLLTSLITSPTEEHWNRLLKSICSRSNNNNEIRSYENSSSSQARFHVEDINLYKGESWQKGFDIIQRTSLFDNEHFGWKSRVNLSWLIRRTQLIKF